MAYYLVSRHHGAVEWMDYMGYHYDRHLTHLHDYAMLNSGDTVIGSLPINIVADLNERGVCYQHLSLYVPESLRGMELSAVQLSELDAKLECYEVRRTKGSLKP